MGRQNISQKINILKFWNKTSPFKNKSKTLQVTRTACQQRRFVNPIHLTVGLTENQKQNSGWCNCSSELMMTPVSRCTKVTEDQLTELLRRDLLAQLVRSIQNFQFTETTFTQKISYYKECKNDNVKEQRRKQHCLLFFCCFFVVVCFYEHNTHTLTHAQMLLKEEKFN